MTDRHRYEIKFVLNDVKLAEFYSWLWSRTSMKEAYPQRTINSLYFDDLNFQSVKDNIAGLPDREKYRMRWYSDKNNLLVRDIKLEKKVREGRLGYKKVVSLSHLQEGFLQNDIAYLKRHSTEQFSQLGLFESRMANAIFPTLHVNYQREYFQDLDDIRITIDQDVDFYHVNDCGKLFAGKPLRWQKTIIEFKFAPEMKDKVAELIRPLHLVPQRCSKYLQGLACNSMVMY